MIFTIVKRNLNTGSFLVSDESGKTVQVSDSQIVNTMLHGYAYTNARPTNKGFSYIDGPKTHYVQVDNLPSDLKKQLKAMVQSITALEQQKKKQLEMQRAQLAAQQNSIGLNQTQRPRPKAVARPKAIARPNTDTNKVNCNANRKSSIYRGQVFSSDQKMCEYYHRDYATYMELRAQGHSVGASLGQVPLQNNQELKTAQSLEKTLDSMELRRGEYH